MVSCLVLNGRKCRDKCKESFNKNERSGLSPSGYRIKQHMKQRPGEMLVATEGGSKKIENES